MAGHRQICIQHLFPIRGLPIVYNVYNKAHGKLGCSEPVGFIVSLIFQKQGRNNRLIYQRHPPIRHNPADIR